MKHRLEKCMRIVTGLVSFCQRQGGEEFQIHMTHNKGDGVSAMTVSCPIPGLEEEVIRGFSDQLDLPRQHEVEESYWELSGSSEPSDELALAGMMIDEVKVGYLDGVLYIHAWRKD